MTGIWRDDLALLALRLGVGSVLFAHGAQKLFGWFGGSGLAGATENMEKMGFTPGRPNALAAGLGEAGGGTLLALGLATPLAGAAASATMATAVSVHAPSGFFAYADGFELPGVLGCASAALALAGPGRFSLDHLIGHSLNRTWMVPLALAAGAVGAITVIRRRLTAGEKRPEEEL